MSFLGININDIFFNDFNPVVVSWFRTNGNGNGNGNGNAVSYKLPRVLYGLLNIKQGQKLDVIFL